MPCRRKKRPFGLLAPNACYLGHGCHLLARFHERARFVRKRADASIEQRANLPGHGTGFPTLMELYGRRTTMDFALQQPKACFLASVVKEIGIDLEHCATMRPGTPRVFPPNAEDFVAHLRCCFAHVVVLIPIVSKNGWINPTQKTSSASDLCRYDRLPHRFQRRPISSTCGNQN